MASYDLNKGLYPNPLRYLLSDGGTVNRDFVEGNPSVEAGSTNWYVLCITPDEMLQIRSTIAVGAPIAYPDTYQSLFYVFDQLFEFPNQFPPESCVDICQLVLDCIETNTDIQNAIAQYALGSGIDLDTPEQQENLDVDLFGGQSASCNNDNIFGATTQLVDWLNTLSSDVLELFETAFATPSRLGDLIEAIPIIGELPFDDALQFLEKISQQVKSAYDAAYDTQIRDDFRCDLFCEAQDTCTLTVQQARDYFQGKITNTVNNTDFSTVVNDIIANNWLGEQSIYVMHWFILDALIFGTEILGIDVNRAQAVVATFFNDPDPDWSLLCACANTWNWSSDYPANNGGWSAQFINGVDWAQYVASVGWESVDILDNTGSYRTALAIQIDFATPVVVTSFSINYDFQAGSGGSNPRAQIRTYYQGNQNSIDNQDNENGSGLGMLVTPNTLVDQLWIFLRPSSNSNQTIGWSGSCALNSVSVSGEGTIPPEFQ